MVEMIAETKNFLAAIGLEINRTKQATNEPLCADESTLLESTGVYKYLGILEDKDNKLTKESFIKLQNELLARVDKLCR